MVRSETFGGGGGVTQVCFEGNILAEIPKD